MIVYRISGEGLLALVRMAASAPNADADTLLGIVIGCDREPMLPNVADGPIPSIEGEAEKPAKPE